MSVAASFDSTADAATPLSGIFQRRLAHLVAERAAAATPKQRSQVQATMFKLFLDAVDLGLIDDAQQILKQVNQAPAS